MTAPKIDTQAPERVWLDVGTFNGAVGFAHSKQHHPGEWKPYVAEDLSAAREAAGWIAGRDAAAADTAQFGRLFLSNGDDVTVDVLGDIRSLTPPTDPAVALDRLIAERVNAALKLLEPLIEKRVQLERASAVEAEREACIIVLDDLYRCMSCGTTFLTSKGHYDEDCPKNHASWDGASEEQKIAAIRARCSKEGQP